MSLTRITNAKIIRTTVKSIELAFKAAGTRSESVVGFPGGSEHVAVWWSEQAGIWLCPPSQWPADLNRFWFGYGTVRPGDKPSIPIAVEINFPKEGINRRVKGLIAVDSNGRLFICHSGHLGGRLGAGTRDAFAQFWGRESVAVLDDDGKSSVVFPVAEVGSDRMITQIAEFVRACAAFKGGEVKPESDEAPSFFGGANEEFEGTKTVAAIGPYTANCDHGIIRNRLTRLLRDAGFKVGRDQARDLFIGSRSKPDAEFEIKTGCDPQSVYTAVGQLLMHSVTTPAKSKIVVLPSPIPSTTRDALRSLNLQIIEYHWTKTSIHFGGLADLYPVAKSSAPINPTT